MECFSFSFKMIRITMWPSTQCQHLVLWYTGLWTQFIWYWTSTEVPNMLAFNGCVTYIEFRFPYYGEVVSSDPWPVYVLTFRAKQVNYKTLSSQSWSSWHLDQICGCQFSACNWNGSSLKHACQVQVHPPGNWLKLHPEDLKQTFSLGSH